MEALLAAERSVWDYLGGSDPAQLKKGLVKTTRHDQREEETQKVPTCGGPMVNLWM